MKLRGVVSVVVGRAVDELSDEVVAEDWGSIVSRGLVVAGEMPLEFWGPVEVDPESLRPPSAPVNCGEDWLGPPTMSVELVAVVLGMP